MTYRTMYDAATPLAHPPPTDACIVYVGGQTPHPWTDADIESQGRRGHLPTWVHWPGRNGLEDAERFAAWLEAHKVPHGSAVCVDMETAIDNAYCETMYQILVHYFVLLYGSTNTLFGNPEPDAWFPADWTGHPHMYPHDLVAATQYATPQQNSGGPYDLSLLSPALEIWDASNNKLIHYVTDGKHSLWALAQAFGTDIQSLLRVTVNHSGHVFPEALHSYLNAGHLNEPIPDGIPLVIRPGNE